MGRKVSYQISKRKLSNGGTVINSHVSFGLLKLIPLPIPFILQIMQSIGFLGPAFFLTQLSHVRTPAMAVLCMACSQVEAKL